MIFLYILLGIILLIALLMLVPVSVKISYHKDFSFLLKIGFVPITLYPKKPEKTKKTKKKKKKPEKEKKKTNLLEDKGFSWFINLIKKVANLANGVLKDFFRHILIKRFMLSIRVVGDDAADTAVKYGYYCSVVYPAVGIIVGAVKCKSYGIDISPDFAESATPDVTIELEAKTLVLWLAVLVLKHGIKGLKLLKDLLN